MNLIHFLFLFILGTNAYSTVAVQSSFLKIESPTDTVEVVENLHSGDTHTLTDDFAPLDDTVHYDDTTVPDTWFKERAFPTIYNFLELVDFALNCNYSVPLIPPMVFRSTLAWCRDMLGCDDYGQLIATNPPGPSAIEQSSWNWCRAACDCYELDRRTVHYNANFGCLSPAGGWIHGAIGGSAKRDGESSSDPDATKFLDGLVMEENLAVPRVDNTTKDWPEEILAEPEGVKLGYDPTDPAWVNPIYMLTSCTLYPAMDAEGLILAMAKMMDWCGCENLLNTENQQYGGVSVYDPATNVRVWACRYVSSSKDPQPSMNLPSHSFSHLTSSFFHPMEATFKS